MKSDAKRRADFFTPDIPPTDPEALPTWISNQMKNLSESINNVNTLHLSETYAWPPGYKPREGDMVWAHEDLIPDNPEGVYIYMDGSWVPLAAAGGAGGGETPVGGIIMWTGDYVPTRWTLCDGTNAPNGMPTPNLVSQFVKGSNLASVGETGGSSTTGGTSLSTAQMPKHSHTMSHTHNIGSHTHSMGSHSHTQKGTFSTDTTGNHNHGITSYVSTTGRHGASGTSSHRYFPNDPPYPSANTEGNHSHSVTISGQTGSSSGTTGGSGTLTTAGASNATTSEVGSGSAHTHSIDPPYYSLAYIMRYE
tara:strand:- start:402 stop:1322 length:921 start_codon:yes stop_codon:yes gene_type:complete